MEWGDILPYLTLVVTTVGLIVAAFWSLMRWSNVSTSELLDAKLTTLSTKMEATGKKVDALAGAVAEWRAETAQHFTQVNGKLDTLASDVAVVRERVARIEERVGIPAEPVGA